MSERVANVALAAAGGGTARWLLWGAVFGVIALLVLYPVVWLILGSFQTPSADWTLEHYREVFSPYYLKLLWNSLVFAALSTVVATLIGVPMAWAVARTDMPGKNFFRGATAITFVLPPLFQAMAFVMIFQPNAGLMNWLFQHLFGVKPFNIFSFTGLVLVTAAGAFPQSFILIDGALRSMDPALEEAAKMAGASRWRIMTRITLPLVLPSILTAISLTFINNLVVFGPPALIGIPAKIYVMSSQIYVELTAFPPRLEFTAALAILFLTFAAMLLTFQIYVLRRRNFATVVGKGMRPREQPLGRWKWVAWGLFTAMVSIALILPVAILVTMSFSRVWTNWFMPDNFTFSHYTSVLFTRTETLHAIGNTILLALATVATTLTAGFVVAYIITKTRHPARQVLNYLMFLPYSIPGAVFTVGVVLAFIRPPLVLYGTLWILVVCYFARFLPFAIQPLAAALRQIDDSLLEAGRVAGASWFRTTRRITLPLLKFSVFSTVMLVFVDCAREVVSAVLLAAPDTETMMVTAFRMWEEGLIQETAALMVVLLVLVLAFFWVVRRAIGERMFN
jgi:iron(III) transport system permease protein